MVGFSNFLGPKTAHSLAENGINHLHKTIKRSTLALAAIMAVFCVVILLFGGQIVTVIYGGKYAGNGFLISSLAFGYLSLTLATPLTHGLLAIGRPDVPFKSYILGTVITVVLGVPLIRSLGMQGAGLSIAFSGVASASFKAFYYFKLKNGSSTQPFETLLRNIGTG